MSSRPNIILILMDQLRYDVLGHNDGLARTPHLDRLASEGIRFTRAFTPTGICSPARGSILTGVYPHTHGVRNNVSGPDALSPDLSDDLALLPRELARVGYRSSYVGKYHIARHEDPTRHGFDRASGTGYYWTRPDFLEWRQELGYPVTPESPALPISKTTDYAPVSAHNAHRATQIGVPVLGRDPVPLEASAPAFLLRQALAELERLAADATPFFLTLSFVGPHWPHVLPEPYWSMYDPADVRPWPSFADDLGSKPGGHRKARMNHGIESWQWEDWAPVVATYLGSVSMHDELIGRFLGRIGDAGLADDTLVVVTADHGDMTGSHGLFNKGPVMYDDLYRVPLLARLPASDVAGSVVSDFASPMDLMPTFLAAAGEQPLPGLDGIDLGPALRGEPDRPAREAFMGEFEGNEFGLYSQRMLRTEGWKYVYNAHDIDELYDMDADPWEMENLAASAAHAGVRRELAARLWELMHASRDPLAAPAANFLA